MRIKNKYNNQKRIYDIWFKNKNVANYFLLNKWKKILNVFHYFRFIWIYINKYNFGKEFLIHIDIGKITLINGQMWAMLFEI